MPSILSRQWSGRFALWLVDLDLARPALDAAEDVRPRLAADDEARAARFADRQHGARWRAARIALRMALERMAGDAVRGTPLVIEPHGRPSLPGSGVVFSLAHTIGPAAAHALIAVATDGPIGCDIEREREVAMTSRRRARLRHAAETLAPLPQGDAGEIAAWVRLEALGKADGRGVWPVLDAAGVHGGSAPADEDAATTVRGFARALGVSIADVVLPVPLHGAVAAPSGMLGALPLVPRGIDDLLSAGVG